jgi:ElaB/YqjD/DUF883 family membrane-anchored ribosome-binding protein
MNARKTESASKSQQSESVSESWDQLSEHLEKLREDISGLNAAVSNLARAGVSEGRERAAAQLDDLARRTAEMGEEIQARGRRAAMDARHQAGTMSRDLENAINRNPITAMLIALGLGFIIGMSSRGRN